MLWASIQPDLLNCHAAQGAAEPMLCELFQTKEVSIKCKLALHEIVMFLALLLCPSPYSSPYVSGLKLMGISIYD